jgi:predicted DNA-binding transcriptional regulator YafY
MMAQNSNVSAQSFCAVDYFRDFSKNIFSLPWSVSSQTMVQQQIQTMPVNRNALIRYRTLDNCLRNRQRRWTLEDLVDACSDALYEYDGMDKGVSKRTVQMDLQLMRSDKLGYNAPIIVLEKKYYTYEDADYSITNIPLTNQDIGKLTEVVEILRQFKGFSHFQELSGMVQRLENKIHSAKTKQEPVIDFEKNENLKGLEHIEALYRAITNKKAVELSYQSFKAREANDFVFHPCCLKEYRNRWFVLGIKKKDAPIMTLALDRIGAVRDSSVNYIKQKDFNVSEYFRNVIGVTVDSGARAEEVVLFADRETAPYILTKPLHQSQNILEVQPNGVTFSITVQLNFELEREILGFGDRIKVLAPDRLKRRMKEKFEHALDLYQYEFNSHSFPALMKKFEHLGFAILRNVFTRKETNLMKGMIDSYFKNHPNKEPHAIRNLFGEIPSMKDIAINVNLKNILKRIDPNLFISKAIFFDKSPDNNWYVRHNY